MLRSIYENQYNVTYQIRLNYFHPLLQKRIEKKWSAPLLPGLDTLNTTKTRCSIIGIIYVKSANKPTVFKEDEKEYETYVETNNEFFVEDLSGRVKINFVCERSVVNGMVVGLLGRKNENGVFIVEDVCKVGKVRKDREATNKVGEKKFVFLSGLRIGEKNQNLEKLKLIAKFTNEIDKIILGPIFDTAVLYESLPLNLETLSKNTTVVAGHGDPTSFLFPLQPLHKKIFGDFDYKFNPEITTIEGLNFILSAGENVKDVAKYLDCGSELKAMQLILDCGYLCPTAPDTLRSEPFSDKDPFFIEKHVDFFVSGNSKSAFVTFEDETCFIGVPDFSKTGEVVVLDVFSRNYEILRFC